MFHCVGRRFGEHGGRVWALARRKIRPPREKSVVSENFKRLWRPAPRAVITHAHSDHASRLDRLAHPKGDRVRLVMSGKFLPYKYYRAEQGVPGYGLKEE